MGHPQQLETKHWTESGPNLYLEAVFQKSLLDQDEKVNSGRAMGWTLLRFGWKKANLAEEKQ